MTVLRLVLPGSAEVGDLDDTRADVLQALADLYAYPAPVPATGWVRANMVTSLDGAATGPDGRSGSISGTTDKAVFGVLRGLADVVLVGAGTARSEGYSLPRPKPAFAERRAAERQAPSPRLAVVTRSGALPSTTDVVAPAADTLVVTCASADLRTLRDRFGTDRVLVSGEERVDPAVAVAQLAARGLRRILLEGGPHLLGDFVASRRLDELCLTLSPVMVGGEGPRLTVGEPGTLDLRLAHLVEAGGTLLSRWLVQR
jgi:riboflavin biosynthesis pyrimidine reductase